MQNRRIDDMRQAGAMVGEFIQELSLAAESAGIIAVAIDRGEIAKAKELALAMSKGIQAHIPKIIDAYSTPMTDAEVEALGESVDTFECCTNQVGNA